MATDKEEGFKDDTKDKNPPAGKAAASMVPRHPAAPAATLHPVEDLAAERGMPATALAGLRRATGWHPGKQVTAEQFEAAMTAYRGKPMGSGSI
jgi:hypothetical protein